MVAQEDKKYWSLVTFENGKIQLNEEVARATFASSKYARLKVHLVSVIGPTRTGKSFLIAFLAEGLICDCINGLFKSGYERVTEGIKIFYSPMIFTDEKGVQHAVFFLDTQGTFDLQSDPEITEWITTLNLLISDIQIVNLQGNITGEDLRTIHRSTEIAAAMRNQQMARNLLFMIRDAAQPNVDGAEFLNRIWSQGSNSKELKEIVNSLQSRYPQGKAECILTQMPSNDLAKASGLAIIREADMGILHRFEEVKRFIQQTVACNDREFQCQESHLLYWKNAIDFLMVDAPRITTTTQMTQESTIINNFNDAYKTINAILEKATLEDWNNVSEKIQRSMEAYFQKNLVFDFKLREELSRRITEQHKKDSEKRRQDLTEERRIKVEEERAQESVEKGRKKIQDLESIEEAIKFHQSGLIRETAKDSSKVQNVLETVFSIKIRQLLPSYFKDLIRRQNQVLREKLQKETSESIDKDEFLRKMEDQLGLLQVEVTNVITFLSVSSEEVKPVLDDARNEFMKTAENAFKFSEKFHQYKMKKLRKQKEAGELKAKEDLIKEEMRKIRETAQNSTIEIVGFEEKRSQILNNELENAPENYFAKGNRNDWASEQPILAIQSKKETIQSTYQTAIITDLRKNGNIETIDRDSTPEIAATITTTSPTSSSEIIAASKEALLYSDRNPLKDQQVVLPNLARSRIERNPSIRRARSTSNILPKDESIPKLDKVSTTTEEVDQMIKTLKERKILKGEQSKIAPHAAENPVVQRVKKPIFEGFRRKLEKLSQCYEQSELAEREENFLEAICFEGRNCLQEIENYGKHKIWSLIDENYQRTTQMVFKLTKEELFKSMPEPASTSYPPNIRDLEKHMKTCNELMRGYDKNIGEAQDYFQGQTFDFELSCLEQNGSFFMVVGLIEGFNQMAELIFMEKFDKPLFEAFAFSTDEKKKISDLKKPLPRRGIKPCVEYPVVQRHFTATLDKMYKDHYGNRTFKWLKATITTIRSTFENILYSRDFNVALESTLDTMILEFWLKVLLREFPKKDSVFLLELYSYLVDSIQEKPKKDSSKILLKKKIEGGK